jgi:hypothetical protein
VTLTVSDGTQETAQIRNLTSDEVETISGALKLSVGPFNAKFDEDGLFLSLGIDGVGMFNIDAFGVWIVAGDNVIA